MQSPFKRYKNADLWFPSSDISVSEILEDEYGNPRIKQDIEEIHVEAYLKPLASWSSSEARLFQPNFKQSGTLNRGGNPENYLSLYGYLISPLDFPSKLKASVLNGKAEIKMNSFDTEKGYFKLLKVIQPAAVIPYTVSQIITRINGIFTWQ